MAAAVAANAIEGESTVRGLAASVASSYPELRRRPRARLDGRGAAVDDRRRARSTGPSGSGKSTVARGVAAALGLEVLDTGAMYRAVTLAALERGLDLDDGDAIAASPRRPSSSSVTRERHVLDGRDVSAEIRGPDVTPRCRRCPRIRPCARSSSRGSGSGSRAPWRRRRRGSRHRHRRVPGRAGQGLPHRRRRASGPAGASATRTAAAATSRPSSRCRTRSTVRDALDSSRTCRRCGLPTTRS